MIKNDEWLKTLNEQKKYEWTKQDEWTKTNELMKGTDEQKIWMYTKCEWTKRIMNKKHVHEQKEFTQTYEWTHHMTKHDRWM